MASSLLLRTRNGRHYVLQTNLVRKRLGTLAPTGPSRLLPTLKLYRMNIREMTEVSSYKGEPSCSRGGGCKDPPSARKTTLLAEISHLLLSKTAILK